MPVFTSKIEYPNPLDGSNTKKQVDFIDHVNNVHGSLNGVRGGSQFDGTGFGGSGTDLVNTTHNGMMERSRHFAALGNTNQFIRTSVLGGSVLSLTQGKLALNESQVIPAGTSVQIDFWASISNATNLPDSGITNNNSLTENRREADDDLILKEYGNGGYGDSSSIIAVKFKRSTTNLDDNAFSDLTENGTIRGFELPEDAGPGQGTTMNAYRINFTVPEGGRFYRFEPFSVDGASVDHIFIFGLQVKMDPATIQVSSSGQDSLGHSALGGRHVHIKKMDPAYISVKITEQTDATAGEHNPFAPGFAGAPMVSADSGDITFTSSGRFVVNADGAYEINVVAYIPESMGKLTSFKITKNTTVDLISILYPGVNNSSASVYEPSHMIHGIFDLASDDILDFVVSGDGGNTVRTNKGSSFTIRRVA